jgi:TatD DNase family protein
LSWFDSHCHLPVGSEASPLIEEARAAGVVGMVTVGTDAPSTRAAVALARAHEGVWATAGLHPHDATNGVETIVEFLDEAGVVAVGECGLDYHYDRSPRPVQKQAFAAQVGLAHDRRLTLVIHTREAWDDMFAILRAEGAPERTVFHCFTGGPAEIRTALDLGAWVSFSGIVTFKGADAVRAAAALCPLDRLLVETDAPFLAPEPRRRPPNRPALLPLVGAGVAQARGTDVANVAAATLRNARQAFALGDG